MMGKEVKIGLSVIGVLLCVFGGVLYMRLSGNKSMPPVAKKAAEKASLPDKDRASDPRKGEGDDGGESNEQAPGKGPSLRMVLPDRENSAEPTVRENKQRDVWTESQPRGASIDSDQENAPAAEERQPPADRYGRRYGDDGGFNAAVPDRRYGNDSFGQAPDDLAPATDESPAESPAMSEGAYAGDELPGGKGLAEDSGRLNDDRFEAKLGQPGDGYRLADENLIPDEAEVAGQAENDPFPAASEARFSHSKQPQVGLQASGAEVPLAPIANSGRERLAADNEPPARQFDERYGDAASSGFAPVSNRQRTRTEEYDRFSPDVGGDLSGESDFASESRFGGGDGVYVVQANDSFAAISKKVYGTDAYFQALHEFNRERFPNPDLLDVGDEIAAPDVTVLQQNYPELCPKPRKSPLQGRDGAMSFASQPGSARGGQVYLVAEGDTLFDIAKRQLGKASRWKEIYDLNQDRLGEDFNYLAPGMELRMPGDRVKPDPVVERPYPSRLRR